MNFEYNEDAEMQKDAALVVVKASDGVKCPRCWHYHYVFDNHDSLCDRCCNVILNDHPNFDLEVTSGILAAYKKQRQKWNVPTSDKMKLLQDKYCHDNS